MTVFSCLFRPRPLQRRPRSRRRLSRAGRTGPPTSPPPPRPRAAAPRREPRPRMPPAQQSLPPSPSSSILPSSGVPFKDILRAPYGLTPAECRVALVPGNGQAPRKIANMVGITDNTVRSFLEELNMVNMMSVAERVLGYATPNLANHVLNHLRHFGMRWLRWVSQGTRPTSP